MRVAVLLAVLCAMGAAASLTPVTSKTGAVRSETIPLPVLSAGSYSLLYAVSPLRELGPAARVEVELRQGATVLASKTLHAGDADYYTQFRVPQSGAASGVVRASGSGGKYSLLVNRWPASAAVKTAPDRRWQDAQAIALGETVFASGDDDEYIPLPGTSRKTLADRSGGDWYKFEFASAAPKLVFFQVELTERDQNQPHLALRRWHAAFADRQQLPSPAHVRRATAEPVEHLAAQQRGGLAESVFRERTSSRRHRSRCATRRARFRPCAPRERRLPRSRSLSSSRSARCGKALCWNSVPRPSTP